MHADASGRYRQQCVEGVRQLAGMGDQDDEPKCENGTPGCPGPGNAAAGVLSCPSCFLSGGEEVPDGPA